MQGWEDLAGGEGECSNLTPRGSQAKPLPDRRACLGHKGSSLPSENSQVWASWHRRTRVLGALGRGPHGPGRKTRGSQEEGWLP